MSRLLLGVWAAVLASLPSQAQESGMVFQASVQKKVTNDFSVSMGMDALLRNNFRNMERWSFSPKVDYRLTNWLKADAGYILLSTYYLEKQYPAVSGDKYIRCSDFWDLRHRFYASLTVSFKPVDWIQLSVRERWQYTYRPELNVSQWDADNQPVEDRTVQGYGIHLLRSFLQIGFIPRESRLRPFANMEIFSRWASEKIICNIGTNIKMSDRVTLSVFYRYKHLYSRGKKIEPKPDIHYLGIAYKYIIPVHK